MTVLAPQFHQNAGTVYTAEQMRRVMRWLAGNGVTGPLKLGDFAVTQNGSPNMSVNVAAGDLGLLGTESTIQGLYYFLNDATKNVAINTADGTNPRNTLIVGRVRDDFYSGAFRDGDVIAIDGSPAPSPVDPSPGNNAVIIARVRVDAGATSIVNAKITDLRVWRNQRILPGSAGWFVRNSADSADNIGMTDAGLLTFRNALVLPAAAAGTPAATSYSSMPIKIDETGPLGSSAASIRLPASGSLPTGFRSLQIRWALRGTVASNSVGVIVQFNGDSSAIYDQQSTTIIGTAAPADNESNGTGTPGLNTASAATASANHFGTGTAEIENYNSTAMFKSLRAKGGYSVTTGTTQRAIVDTFVIWRSTAAITSILLTPVSGSWDVGSWAAVYGIP